MARCNDRVSAPEPPRAPTVPSSAPPEPPHPAPAQPWATPWAVRIAASERNDLLLEPALSLW